MSQPFLILSVLLSYLLIWWAISYFSSRKADNFTFFLGNRKMPWFLIAFAMIGAPMTGVTFISVPGMVVTKSFSYLQMGLGFIVGYLIIALILIPVYYKYNIVSIYSFLERRFGDGASKTGAWLFFISKIFGISIRFLIVCSMLQLLVFEPLNIPFIISVLVSMTFIWLVTYRGGVKSVILGDVLKTFCLLTTLALCFFYIKSNLNLSVSEFAGKIFSHDSTRVFFLDDPLDGKYFWKQFIAGIFIVIAMTGLDQDMMQRTLACKNGQDAKKNLIFSSIFQFLVCLMFLLMGIVLMIYMEAHHLALPEKTDNLFATVVFDQGMPLIVGAMLVLGVATSTFASVGSALTAMTTTVTIDIMQHDKKLDGSRLANRRKLIHTVICLLMSVCVIFFFYINDQDAISTIYTLISYTDGPILGLFIFAIFTSKKIKEKFLPAICIASPLLAWLWQWLFQKYFGYETGFELLVINALITFLLLYFSSSSFVTKIYSKNSR